jgi:hypothetical protein
MMRVSGRLLMAAAGAIALAGLNAIATASAAQAADKMSGKMMDKAKVITLTQTGCQFLEPEGMDHHYKTAKKADCDKINAKTEDGRLAKSKVMKLKPGKYIFRVTNKNVPYMLGFYLRGQGLGRLTLPKTSGGGLYKGVTKDYEITLKPGDYYYSCPLNTTPDYKIHVGG